MWHEQQGSGRFYLGETGIRKSFTKEEVSESSLEKKCETGSISEKAGRHKLAQPASSGEDVLLGWIEGGREGQSYIENLYII